jgi:hypothetical protein
VKTAARRVGRAIPVIRRVRSLAGMIVVVSVTAGGFALATVSAAGTGAIAIPTPRNSSVAHATRVLADLISPVPEAKVTEQKISDEQLVEAFARQTAAPQCAGQAPAGSALIELSADQIAELTARAASDPDFASRVASRQQQLCGGVANGGSSRAHPESVVQVG